MLKGDFYITLHTMLFLRDCTTTDAARAHDDAHTTHTSRHTMTHIHPTDAARPHDDTHTHISRHTMTHIHPTDAAMAHDDAHTHTSRHTMTHIHPTDAARHTGSVRVPVRPSEARQGSDAGRAASHPEGCAGGGDDNNAQRRLSIRPAPPADHAARRRRHATHALALSV